VQHKVRHCNTVQHMEHLKITHCNTVQHKVRHCNTVQRMEYLRKRDVRHPEFVHKKGNGWHDIVSH